VNPKLREIIDATPTVGVKTFLVTHFGKPYTAPGFGNWFRRRMLGRIGAWLAKGDRAPPGGDRMHCAPDRGDHWSRVIE